LEGKPGGFLRHKRRRRCITQHRCCGCLLLLACLLLLTTIVDETCKRFGQNGGSRKIMRQQVCFIEEQIGVRNEEAHK